MATFTKLKLSGSTDGFGGVAAPDDHIEINIGAEGTGLVLVSPGLLLTNSLVVKAFAGTANVVTLTGYVNRIA